MSVVSLFNTYLAGIVSFNSIGDSDDDHGRLVPRALENNLRYHKGCCLFGLLRSLGARRAGHEYLLLFIARDVLLGFIWRIPLVKIEQTPCSYFTGQSKVSRFLYQCANFVSSADQ